MLPGATPLRQVCQDVPVRSNRRVAVVLALVSATLVTGCGGGGQGGQDPARWSPAAGPDAVAQPPTVTPSVAPPTPTASRPAPAATRPARTPAGTGTGTPGTVGRYAFPVAASNVSYHPTHSAYPATDIFADCGEPVVAVTSGKVLEVSRVDRYTKSGVQGPYNGGRSVSLLGDDGVRYYGSHLTTVASGVEAGVRVRAGQRLGTVGRTGNANNVCHLHFGISPPCRRTGDWWIRRGVVWPAPFLDAWRRHSNRSPAETVSRWHREHGCPTGA